MSDYIYIRDLALRCIIGIYPDEREKKQDVLVNVRMTCDCAPAASSDDIADAVDYKSIKKKIIEMVEPSAFNLVETLADRIARICLEDKRITGVCVTVDKPGALRFARSVAVEINRP